MTLNVGYNLLPINNPNQENFAIWRQENGLPENPVFLTVSQGILSTTVVLYIFRLISTVSCSTAGAVQ